MYGLYLAGVMIVTGGAIAFIGDKLGTKIGKKRLSIFGLRPRHTSMIITVLTGFLITALSIGMMAITSENVRTALFGMEELNANMESTRKALENVTLELFEAQREHKLADADLEKSKKEIADLKSEQDKLKAGNAELSALNSDLESQNKTLNDTNSTLESENKKLGEVNVTLTADNEKLNADNEKLEEHAKNLRDGLVAIREGNITLRAGEILSGGIVKGGRAFAAVDDDLNGLIETASKNIAERFGGEVDSAIWIYQPEMNDVTEKISSGNGEFFVRVTAAGNLVKGEPVRANLQLFRNNLIYKKNEFILSRNYEVNDSSDSEKIVSNFLTEVNHSAVVRGILTDPITGAVGAMEGTQLYQIVDIIENVRGKIILSAYAREETYSNGPLRLNIRVEKN